jgi:ATP-dependent Clp protease ATP-binding subunit ClpA
VRPSHIGARPLKRVIDHTILNELSKELLADRIPRGSIVRVSMNDNGSALQFNVVPSATAATATGGHDDDATAAIAAKKLQRHIDSE